MPLDLAPLTNAVLRLDEGLQRYQRDITDAQIRDGLIQRFEYTYEQCHRMLKRFLEQRAATPEEYDQADFQYLIRSGNEQGLLLGDWLAWRAYRDMRARTSHTYDEAVAVQVVSGIPAFLAEAQYLRNQLQQKNR